MFHSLGLLLTGMLSSFAVGLGVNILRFSRRPQNQIPVFVEPEKTELVIR